MALTTYDELKAAIADTLNRDDLTAVIPDFITMAESDMNMNVRHWRQEERAIAPIDTQYSAIPSDFLEVISFHISSGDFRSLELISKAEMLDRRYKSGDASGKPAFYAITAGEIEVYPTPDGEYTTELYYFSRLDALSASNTTNWMLEYFPSAYLYGSLVHSAPYLKDDARVQLWAGLYAGTINAINLEGERSKTGGSGRRMRIRSY
jgi:hypothetical protein